jgi:Polyketide cyclase / dehydrase and lipid transport
VFPFLEASEERLRWMGALVESEPLGEGRFRDVFENAGQRIELDAEVLEREAPKVLVVRLRARSFEATSTQRLEPAGVGTWLTARVETTYTKRLARLAGPLVARRAQRQLEQDLATLKGLAES